MSDTSHPTQSFSVANRARLPTELVDAVISAAWCSFPPESAQTPRTSARWMFFRAIALVARSWRAIILRIRVAHVVLGSPLDVRMYMWLVEEWARASAPPRGARPRMPVRRAHVLLPLGTALVPPRVLPRSAEHAALFGRSHVTVQLDSAELDTRSAAELAHDIAVTIPDAARLTLPGCAALHCMLLRHFAHAPSLRALELALPAEVSAGEQPGLPDLTRVTALHLMLSLGSICLRTLAPLLPRLTHLHLGGPSFLPHTLAGAPDALQVLVLDVRHAEAMAEWAAVTALETGLFSTRNRAERRVLIVNSGPGVIPGWDELAMVCDRRGVHLERRCVFAPE